MADTLHALACPGQENPNDEQLHHDLILHNRPNEEQEMHHHSYAEELSILNSVKEGRAEDALAQSLETDACLGTLSGDELTHWKYAAVAAITLCTRAAIQGGVFPASAYHHSDYFIQKLDDCADIASVLAVRNRAICALADQVNQKTSTKADGYIDKCVDYIVKHYREKIYLEELAASLGLSANYLSKLFFKETGIHFQDYIVRHRVDRSTGLLSHSNMSITDIATYVGFPSQSYFGRVFKKTIGITPRQYRESHRLREFTEPGGR